MMKAYKWKEWIILDSIYTTYMVITSNFNDKNLYPGLDDALQVYIPHLLEAEISGAQLLALDYDDLDNLGVVSIGHQELILEGTDLLKQLVSSIVILTLELWRFI